MKKLIFLMLLFSMSYADSARQAYKPKDFTALISKVPSIDESLWKMHFQLYEGYVKNTNALADQLYSLLTASQDRGPAFGALKRRFNWEYDGMVLHELYFANWGGNGELSKNSALFTQIVKDFGSYDNFKKDFISTGLMRGIGWVILYRDANDGFLHNIWVEEHDLGHLAGGKPLLVMDVWEHAYITQFGLNRAHYIDLFFANLNWSVVSDRYESTLCPKK